MVYSIWRYRVRIAAVLVAIAAAACGGGDGGGGTGAGAGGGSTPGTTSGTPPSAAAGCGPNLSAVGTKYEAVVDIFNSAGVRVGFDTFTKGEVLPATTFNGNTGAFPAFTEIVTTPIKNSVEGTPTLPGTVKNFAGSDGSDAFAYGAETISTTVRGTETITRKFIAFTTPAIKRPLNPIQGTITKQTVTLKITDNGAEIAPQVVSREETFLGKEDIEVPAGKFVGACKYKTFSAVEDAGQFTVTTWKIPGQALITIQESIQETGITRKLASYKITAP